MAVVTMKRLLETGIHFGHQTKRWNPKMDKFIFTKRNGIHILDLHQTIKNLETSYNKVKDVVSNGGNVLFVGTKRQAQEGLEKAAKRCGMPYISNRWLGGMLTNYKTISKRIKRLKELEKMEEDGTLELLPNKEEAQLNKELTKLRRNLGGIKDMKGMPELLFVVDTVNEEIAVKEANKLGIPVIAMVDTNVDPTMIDYPIPANDDAIRGINLISKVIADAVVEANQGKEEEKVEEDTETKEESSQEK
ncbi:MAG: 30S ribosomal protein S2 [Fusobacteriota bacterium]